MEKEICKHDFPWDVNVKTEDFLTKKNKGQAGLLDGLFNDLPFGYLQYFWEFLHIYYVTNRTLKAIFYIDYIKDNKGKKKIDLYFIPKHSIYQLIKPRLLPASPVNKLPKEIKDAYFCYCYKDKREKAKFCQSGNIQELKKELELIIKYNCHILNLNESEFSFKDKEKDPIDFGEVSYLIGLYKLFSWNNLNEDFLNIFNSIFELTENNMEERELPKQQHSLFERLYNKITGSLIAEKIRKNGVKVEFLHNFTIKVPGLFFNKNNIEIDIAFWNKENCKIVFIETTAHKKEEDEWKNHFTKKSAISNILFQQAKDKGWSVRYIYFYSFGFSSAERAFGVENFSENGTHFIFLPMWNFKQYKFLLNFNDKNWMNYQKQKNKSSLHYNIENELENTLNKLINAVSSFLENG